MELTGFCACWYNFTQMKDDQKIFACAWSKMGVASLVTELKSLFMLVRIQESLKSIHSFLGGHGQK